MSAEPKFELLPGTLDLLVLKVVALGPSHGLRHRATPSANLQGFLPGPPRLSLSRSPSLGRPPLAPIRMERFRNRPRSQVLLAHKKRPQTNGSRSPQLGAPLQRRRSGPPRPGEGVLAMRWLRRLFQKSRADHDLDRELHFHLERQIADHIAAGISAEEARRRANLEFGGLERVKEEVRDTRWENSPR